MIYLSQHVGCIYISRGKNAAYDISFSELYAEEIPHNEARNKQIYDLTQRGHVVEHTKDCAKNVLDRQSLLLQHPFIKATLAIMSVNLYPDLE